MTTDLTAYKIFAHRGFSSRHPEQTIAAYREAIAFAAKHDIELGLECDVQFCADDELICLHDGDLDRTSNASGSVFEWKLDELRSVDFGSWWKSEPTSEETAMPTLGELFDLAQQAIADGIKINLNVEAKHPNPRGLDIEDRIAAMLSKRGWTGPDAPVQLITFDLDALHKMGQLLPDLKRTLLIQVDLGQWADGQLPDGVTISGPDWLLLKDDPEYVERARSHGNEVHPWTVNEYADIEFCLGLGVTGFTTDYPDRVLEVLGGSKS